MDFINGGNPDCRINFLNSNNKNTQFQKSKTKNKTCSSFLKSELIMCWSINESCNKTAPVFFMWSVCEIDKNKPWFQSYSNRELNFHDSCIDVDIKSNIYSAGLNDLPFGVRYIDHNCFGGKVLRLAHLNFRSFC